MAIFIFGSNLTGCEFVCERTHGCLLHTGELMHTLYPIDAGLFPGWTRRCRVLVSDTLVLKSALKTRFYRKSFWTAVTCHFLAVASGERASASQLPVKPVCALPGRDYRSTHLTGEAVSRKCGFDECKSRCCPVWWCPPITPVLGEGVGSEHGRIGSLGPAWAT